MGWRYGNLSSLYTRYIKKYQSQVSLLVKENSRASELLLDDNHIDEIINLDRNKNNSGHHNGISGFFRLIEELKKKKLIKCSSLIALKIFIAGKIYRDKKYCTISVI